MAVNVNTNVAAMTAQRYLNSANSAQQTSMERLSSGFKINSAKDDAAGLQISNRLNVQSRGLDVAKTLRQLNHIFQLFPLPFSSSSTSFSLAFRVAKN